MPHIDHSCTSLPPPCSLHFRLPPVTYTANVSFLPLLPPPPLPPSPPYHWWELPQVSFLLQQRVWNMPLSRQNKSFFATGIFFRNKTFCHTFVATKEVFCCDKHMFVMTKLVATKMILVAAPTNDTSLHQLKHLSVPCLSIHPPPPPQLNAPSPATAHSLVFLKTLSVLLNFT